MSNQNSGSAVSETGDLGTDLGEQAKNLDKGVTTMPLDAAASSVTRWKGALAGLKGTSGVDQVTMGLDQLSQALSGGSPDGKKIGGILTKLGTDVSMVAGMQSGMIATGLQALSRSLTSQGSKLAGSGAGMTGSKM